MKFETSGSPHILSGNSVTKVMLQVLIALVPALFAHVWYFGWGVVVQLILAVTVAVLFEASMLWVRKRPIKPYLMDLSAVVTAVLFALCIPPLLPWWATVTGMFFAIVLAKQLYGGLGYNPFNPAMVAYVVILVSFPLEASSWLAPTPLAEFYVYFDDALRAVFQGVLPGQASWDTITQATPLDLVKEQSARSALIPEIRDRPIFGDFGGKGWEWIANWYALGGLYLMWKRIIPWQVPVAMLGTVVVLTTPAWLFSADSNPFPLQHIFSGAFMLGAFFIATDPVSGCTTPRGRLFFGAGVAIITLMIRRWGVYPDGVAFAVLLMNMAAPLIDQYTRPRVFGHNPPGTKG